MAFVSKVERKRLEQEKLEELAPVKFYKVIEINASLKKKWGIVGKIIYKNDIHPANGSECFDFILNDDTGNIKVTFWKDQCRKFYEIVQIGKEYELQKGTITSSESVSKFSWVKHPFTIRSLPDTELKVTNEKIQPFQFKFETSFNPKWPVKKAVELLGYISKISDRQTYQSPTKSDKVLTKRQVEIKNINREIVNLTFWGAKADKFYHDVKSAENTSDKTTILGLSGAHVSAYQKNGELFIDTYDDTIIVLNPEGKAAQELRKWLDEEERTDDETTRTDADSK